MENSSDPKLGDQVEAFLKATGIHQTVKALEKATGKDCGCAKRKEQLNALGDAILKTIQPGRDP